MEEGHLSVVSGRGSCEKEVGQWDLHDISLIDVPGRSILGQMAYELRS